MSNSQLNLHDERFRLHGDPRQYPRYVSAPKFGGFSDAVAVMQRTPDGPLYKINNDGSIVEFTHASSIDAYMSEGPWLEQVSGLMVAALIHERTAKKR